MTITAQEALQRTIEHREIFPDEMLSIMRRIMSGEVTPVMIAALTVGLRVKKETIGEISAAAQVMREFATKVDVPDRDRLLDIVGTGGDSSHTFNISTASMFVAAAAGARVAKHGGRSVSSKSGSADVLEALGANINLQPEQVAQSIAFLEPQLPWIGNGAPHRAQPAFVGKNDRDRLSLDESLGRHVDHRPRLGERRTAIAECTRAELRPRFFQLSGDFFPTLLLVRQQSL